MKILKIMLSLGLCATLAACTPNKDNDQIISSEKTEKPIQVQASEYVPTVVEDISIGNANNSYHPFLYKDGRMVVFLPSAINGDLHLYSDTKAVLNGKEIDATTLLPNINENSVLNFKNDKYNTKIIFHFLGNLKTLNIKTDSGDMKYLEENKKHKEKAVFALDDKNGNSISNLSMKMKGRGNSSWYGAIQKSFNLTMEDKVSLFGNEPCKKYSMLANWAVPTRQLKNALAFKLGQDLDLEFTPVGEFIDVYTNGAYQGLYFLTTTKDLKSTVDIHNLDNDNEAISEEPKKFTKKYKGFEMVGYDYPSEPKNISGGYLLEFDKRYKDEDAYFENNTTPIVVKSPELPSSAELEYISKFYYDIENSLMKNSKIPDTLDTESWVKDCLLQDFIVNKDIELSSLFAYKKQNIDKLFAGPIWDFDQAFGFNFPDVTTNTLWVKDGYSKFFKAMMDNKGFENKVKTLYQTSFSNSVKNLADVYLVDLAKEIKPSVEMNAMRWANDASSYDKDVSDLRFWLNKRRTFYDDYYKNPDSYSKVTFHLDSYNISYMIKTGEELKHLPLTKHEIGFKTKSGDDFKKNTKIDKDIDLYVIPR